jgi:hypothetical protein
MRFRDISIIIAIASLTALAGLHGSAVIKRLLYQSHAINREDARSVTATLLAADRWVEFQVLRDATTIRLLTNAALNSMDAPDHDLTNPRLGWRYSLDYELLDADRQLLEKSEYHFRTQVRQLVDASTGKPMYPIFLGKSGLVATQTRPMQLAVSGFDSQPAILRIRLNSADPGVQEVVGRSLSRIQREDFDQRYTWTRLSEERRQLVCRYAVYEPDLLSSAEHTNLLRWRWAQTPTLSNCPRRQLYFIGDIEDQEVRDEQLPAGLYTDPNWLATIPVPEGPGRVRLEFHPLDPVTAGDREVDVRWFGISLQQRKVTGLSLANESSSLWLDVNGGMIQVDSPTRIVLRAYWSASVPTSEAAEDEIEITPAPVLIKTFVADNEPVEYSISHLAGKATPLRLSFRYPYGPHFDNLVISSRDDPSAASLGQVTSRWELLDGNGQVVKSGDVSFAPVVSRYEFLELISGNEWLSESHDRYFAVPPSVERVRIRAVGCRLLVNAAVRPAGVSRQTRVPEDYHTYHARESTNRTWFGINPPDAKLRVQANRCFIVRSHTRPPDDDQDISAGNYEWQSFRPQGQWIGRQILVPQDPDREVRDRAIESTYFELTAGSDYAFSSFAAATDFARLIVIADQDAPGRVSLQINQTTVLLPEIQSARSEIDLVKYNLPSEGIINISSTQPARFYMGGRQVAAAQRFLKRTAQRLVGGKLEFEYNKKTTSDELLTIQVYRARGDHDRCRLSVSIQASQPDWTSDLQPTDSWTIRDRIYDLRPHPGQQSVLLGTAGAVDIGHRCFIRLGKELRPGPYKITMQRLDEGGEGYVLLYQTVPGALPFREVRIQSKPMETDEL